MKLIARLFLAMRARFFIKLKIYLNAIIILYNGNYFKLC